MLRVSACADSAHLKLWMCTSAPAQVKTIEGQTDPIQGWVSPLYGKKSPAPTLRVEMQTRAPASALFIMLPSHSLEGALRSVETRSVLVTGGSALACEAEYGGVEDIFVSSFGGQRISIRDFTLNGRFFWLRLKKGCLTRVLGIDCREIRHGDEVLMRDYSGRAHFEYQETRRVPA